MLLLSLSFPHSQPQFQMVVTPQTSETKMDTVTGEPPDTTSPLVTSPHTLSGVSSYSYDTSAVSPSLADPCHYPLAISTPHRRPSRSPALIPSSLCVCCSMPFPHLSIRIPSCSSQPFVPIVTGSGSCPYITSNLHLSEARSQFSSLIYSVCRWHLTQSLPPSGKAFLSGLL